MGRDQDMYDATQNAQYFNPLSPHGERLLIVSPPHAGGRFQSTLPAWGETDIVFDGDWHYDEISIHSPRMGRDNIQARKI